MDKLTLSQATLAAIAQAKAKADKQAQETSAEKFERNFRELIQNEIRLAVEAAETFRRLIPCGPAYTYTNSFPMAIYDSLAKETLTMLELSDIYLSKNNELSNATIRIVINF